MDINFLLPTSWRELSQSKLKFVYGLAAEGLDAETMKVVCTLRWNHVSLIGGQGEGAFLLKRGKHLFEVTSTAMAEIIEPLSFLTSTPDYPVRLEKWRGHRALNALFQGVPFETYIVADNLFQGWMNTMQGQDITAQNDCAVELVHTLYNVQGKRYKCAPADFVNAFYWMVALKQLLSSTFKFFFQPVGDAQQNLMGRSVATAVTDAVDAQIRALTKGDITKEQFVLQSDTWRALVELNALAREYQEINSKTK